MKPAGPTKSDPAPLQVGATRLFCLLAGIWLGLALLKFGNPIILDRLIDPPSGFWEYALAPWPVRWGYGLLFLVILAAGRVIKLESPAPKWVLLAPLAWLGWQLVAATGSVDPALTKATVIHFGACVIAFYLGHFALVRVRPADLGWFWFPILAGFLMVLAHGLSQRFGGLDETIKMVQQQPDWQKLPQEYLLRLMGKRIFATLVYPNAFACVLLLLLPVTCHLLWSRLLFLTPVSRGFLAGLCGITGLACLYWTGSKSGWLIAIVVSVFGLFHLNIQRKTKLIVAGALVIAALTGFFVRYQGYFAKGATSVSARGDYWKAAISQVTKTPVKGSGPGTFGVIYKQQKSKDSEMAQLTHNDYLEQASDSGVPGFFTYILATIGSFLYLYRYRKPEIQHFLVLLGLAGWLMQSAVEFTLYIPALAWPGFMFLGWLTASSKTSKTI